MSSSEKSMLYPFRTFIAHKPLGVVSSTIDSDPPSQARKPKMYESEKSDGRPRKTLYDIASDAGFPADCQLVGRLDVDTSGIILFTDDSRLASGIREPPEPGSALEKSPFKCKEYFLQLLSSQGHDPESANGFDLQALEEELSQPLSFSRWNCMYHCSSADVKILRRYRDEKLSRGRPDLGWCVDVRITLREGKHHQIRRIAKRSGFHVARLHRVCIAGILSVDTIPNPGDCRWLTKDEIMSLYDGLHINNALVFNALA